MGFSDYFIQSVTSDPPANVNEEQGKVIEDDGCDSNNDDTTQKSDQEILENIDDIYFNPNSNPQMYELEVSYWKAGNLVIQKLLMVVF